MAVAAAIPWSVILKTLPEVVFAAKELWDRWSSRSRRAAIDPNADVKAQLGAIGERLAALEAAETDQAKLVSQIAEQLQGVARRVSIAYWLGLSALLLSCGAFLLAVLR
jgi:hypothetical protein